MKAQIGRELDRLELLLEQIKVIEAARDAMLAATQVGSPAPAMLLAVKGTGSEFAAVLWSEGLSRHFDTDDRLLLTPALRRHPGRVARLITTRGSRNQAIQGCER